VVELVKGKFLALVLPGSVLLGWFVVLVNSLDEVAD
jgi:hypothetical protein